MGWDAFAVDKRGQRLERKDFKLEDTILRSAFAEADRAVLDHFAFSDGFLVHGALDCTDCAEAILAATGQNCFAGPWNVQETKETFDRWNWTKVERTWASESAFYFLRACAWHELGVSFSW